jgi:hypothetical protein
MQMKINKRQKESNFLTHGHWSKTKLGMQHIHLELLYILDHSITLKIKHVSRINIYDNYKIVVNSPEVNLGITRSHAEVEHRNLIIFSYNNHLDRFSINTNQFI